MISNKSLFIITSILLLISSSGINIVFSNELNYSSNFNLNNPPQIIKSLTYYDKYNDILYIAARDPDNDKICVGVDWDRDQIIDEWSTYRKIQTRWEFNCNGRMGLVYIIAEDEHGLRSEWHDAMHKIKEFNQNPFLSSFFINRFFLTYPF